MQNMVGAEGLRAANYLYNVAAQDGTVIGGLSRNTGLARFYDFNNAGIQFDARKFHWLGSPQQEIGLFILSTKIRAEIDRRPRRRARSRSARPRDNSPTSIYSRILNATIGTKLKPIEGYAGSQACLLARRAQRSRCPRLRRLVGAVPGAHHAVARQAATPR